MQKLSRISREPIRCSYLKNKDGTINLMDMLHLHVMNELRLTDEEYDKFLELIPDDEFGEYFQETKKLNIQEKRKIIKYIGEANKAH